MDLPRSVELRRKKAGKWLTIAFWQAGGTSVAVGKQAHNKPTFRRVVAVESEVLKNLVFPSFPLGKIVNSTFSPSFFLSVKAVSGSGQSELKQ